jgi:hypothetical protein
MGNRLTGVTGILIPALDQQERGGQNSVIWVISPASDNEDRRVLQLTNKKDVRVPFDIPKD